MRRFWVFLHVFTLLCQVPFAIGLYHALSLLAVPGAPVVAIAAGALAAALLRVPVRRSMVDQPHRHRLGLLGEELYYAHWCGALGGALLFVIGLVGMTLVGFASAGPPAITVGGLALGSYATGLACGLYGVLIRRRWVRVRTVDVEIPGLGAAFDGYRIVQLSDLHLGSMCPRERVDAWVARANTLDADLVALTGDYVTSGTAFHRDIAGALGGLTARDGVFAVMGNHDYFGDGEPLITLMREAGIIVLRNEHTEVTRGGDRLVVAGVDDTWTRRADVASAVAGRDPALPMVALAHDPALFPRLAQKGAGLVLSGHTHWGQVAAPILPTRHNLARLAFRFHAGVYREGSATLYVHPGMGTTGPPIRLGAPPEITVLRLRRAPAAARAAA